LRSLEVCSPYPVHGMLKRVLHIDSNASRFEFLKGDVYRTQVAANLLGEPDL